MPTSGDVTLELTFADAAKSAAVELGAIGTADDLEDSEREEMMRRGNNWPGSTVTSFTAIRTARPSATRQSSTSTRVRKRWSCVSGRSRRTISTWTWTIPAPPMRSQRRRKRWISRSNGMRRLSLAWPRARRPCSERRGLTPEPSRAWRDRHRRYTSVCWTPTGPTATISSRGAVNAAARRRAPPTPPQV
jgi:hypothetical protein